VKPVLSLGILSGGNVCGISAMASVIINWVIEIEEAGLEPDQVVPEYNRFRMLDLNGNLQKRIVWVRCGQRVPGAEDYVNVREFNSTY
jgi:hypothetical protein